MFVSVGRLVVIPFYKPAAVKQQIVARIENAVASFIYINRNFGQVVDIRF